MIDLRNGNWEKTLLSFRPIIPISRNFFLFSCLAVWRMTTIPPCKQSTGLLLSFSSSHWQSVPTSSEATCPDPDSIQTKPRMTSNGGSEGDYQAVETSETRRKRINQVVWKIQSHFMFSIFNLLQTVVKTVGFNSQFLSLCWNLFPSSSVCSTSNVIFCKNTPIKCPISRN